MFVDLDTAAKFYGLHQAPGVVWDLPYGEAVAFSTLDHTIHADPGFSGYINRTREALHIRLKDLGLGELSDDDLMRFAFSHELWHAVQVSHNPEGMKQHAASYNYKADVADLEAAVGLTKHDGAWVHDHDPVEMDADKHAAKAYKLIKIDGR